MASPSKKNTATEERRSWVDLPSDVTASIMSRLTVKDIVRSAQLVCKPWLEVSKDPLVWKRIDMSNVFYGSYLDKMCRLAVDRSCGQAVDLSIGFFGNDDLLKYITDRSTRIKRLGLTYAHNISNKGLIESVAELPLLEELELALRPSIELFEAIGRHCPCLKSFKLSSIESSFWYDKEDDLNKEAVAIGKNMPELCNLEVIGNSMTSKGLRAILEGCPKLESLDLRGCFNINLKREVWERCTEQVKQLRLPSDPTEDYPFITSPGFILDFDPDFLDFDPDLLYTYNDGLCWY